MISEFVNPNAMPVTVLTGFLGAGKTTLLNRMLTESHGLRIAVLVNDFGEVDIDSDLVVGVETGAVQLANGCACCEIRDDLLGAVADVLRSDELYDAIVLEASGVADPIGIARTFVSPEFRDAIRLDGIIAVVDAEQLPSQADDAATRDLVFSQIGFSDLVLLNKIDLADDAAVADVRQFVLDRLPAVRIIETVRCDVPLEVLLGTRSPGRAAPPDRHEHHDADAFLSFVYRSGGVFDLDALEQALSALPNWVYRIKGFVRGHRDPEIRWLVQSVGMRCEVVPFDRWDPARAVAGGTAVRRHRSHTRPRQRGQLVSAIRRGRP
jgi:G3E family GTPase